MAVVSMLYTGIVYDINYRRSTEEWNTSTWTEGSQTYRHEN